MSEDVPFSSADLPPYHDALLLVKVRASLAALAEGAAPAPSTPGLALLEKLHHDGMVKRITALARTVPGKPQGAAAALALATRVMQKTLSSEVNAGASFVELAPRADLARLLRALAEDPHVELAERVPRRYLMLRKPAAPRGGAAPALPPAGDLWNLKRIEWARARARPGFKDAGDVNVAVLDSGIDFGHPDLAGRVAKYVHGTRERAYGPEDIVGHGTHVGGILGASIDNRRGINGVCACRLHAWKIFQDELEFFPGKELYWYPMDPAAYHEALSDCLDGDIDVVNLSLGGSGSANALERDTIARLIAKGATVVAAMGNEGEHGSPTQYPAAFPGVIAVGATDQHDNAAPFSNEGEHITLSAPGTAIWSTLPTYPGNMYFKSKRARGGFAVGAPVKRPTGYHALPGTSTAAPHVAAAAALLIAKRGAIGPAQVARALRESADPVPGMDGKRFHPRYGFGRLNLLRLLD